MFMKLAVVALVLGAISLNHFDLSTAPTIEVKPIAIVKYKDTVYQCQGVITTGCGYTIHCGNMSVHCVDKLVIEYLD